MHFLRQQGQQAFSVAMVTEYPQSAVEKEPQCMNPCFVSEVALTIRSFCCRDISKSFTYQVCQLLLFEFIY